MLLVSDGIECCFPLCVEGAQLADRRRSNTRFLVGNALS